MNNFLSPKQGKFLYWGLALTGFWITFGLYIDGWAHTHDKVDSSFFTPYHGVLYSGLGAAIALITLYVAQGVRKGIPWKKTLPPAYMLAFIGGIIFMVGGVFDLFWHTLFGIEVDVEALYSPSHLMLAIGGVLIVSGPFRAAWRRRDLVKLDFLKDFGALLSLTCFMAIIMFFINIAHPIAKLWGGAEAGMYAPQPAWLFREAGIMGILLTTVITVSAIYLLISRWRLPFGTFTMFLGLSSLGMGFMYSKGPYPWPHVLAYLLAGIAIDILYQMLRPAPARTRELRQFLTVAPAIVTVFYFIAVWLTSGVWWVVHFWTGAIVISGLTGLLMSYLFILPTYDTASDRHH